MRFNKENLLKVHFASIVKSFEEVTERIRNEVPDINFYYDW